MNQMRGLGPFLDELERRLAGLDPDQLQLVLVDHARGLPARARESFLAVFPSDGSAATLTSDATAAPDPGLLDDIDDFVEQVRTGGFLDGWGWDDQAREERPFGDELWTLDADGLFARAEDAFLAGDLELARQAYGRLLAAFDYDYDAEGGLPTLAPEGEVDIDVTEAKARYLRSIHDTVAVGERAARMVEAARNLAFVGGEVSLADIEATRREPLGDIDDPNGRFLANWIEMLAAEPADPYGFGAQARRLLAEATQRHRGVDGLAELARQPGSDRAEAYLDWVDGLVAAGRDGHAMAAAREALTAVAEPDGVRASIAERLAMLAARRREVSTVVEARQAAWRAAPTVDRLVALVGAATQAGTRDQVLAAEIDHATRFPTHASDAGLPAALLLVAGHIDAAARLVEEPDGPHPPGRRRHQAVGRVVTPFLLAAASGAAGHPLFHTALLGRLVAQSDQAIRPWGVPAALTVRLDADPGAAPPETNGLADLLVHVLAGLAPTPSQTRQWFASARGAVNTELETVVGGTQRDAYRSVAMLAVAAAEATVVHDGADTATAEIETLHARYPRHSAFRRELDAAVKRSPLVPDSAARPSSSQRP